MVPRKLYLITVLTVVISILFFTGCDSALRYAPTESQKQSAELTHLLAVKVNDTGTAPGSQAGKQLVDGTAAAVTYMGRPRTPPVPEQFTTIAAQANADASERPDAWQLADSALELGIGIYALLGGVFATKGIGYLAVAKAKSQALKEIVQGNELFKMTMEASGNTAAVDEFKRQQSNIQTGKTPEIVTAETAPIKEIATITQPASAASKA